MKYCFLLLFLFLIGCFNGESLEEINKASSKIVLNEKCENVSAFEVFQVLDKFVLAHTCDSNDYKFCSGLVVYIMKEKNKIYYNDQIIHVPDGKCPEYYDTFTYESSLGSRTVPKVKWSHKEIHNSAKKQEK